MQTGVSTFNLMRARLQWLERRQGVLAQNVANADTPGFRPRDVAPFSAGSRTLAATPTHPAHLATSAGGGGLAEAGRIEARPNGNAVSLEDEMLRMSEVQIEHQTLTGLYQRSLVMMKTAIGRKG